MSVDPISCLSRRLIGTSCCVWVISWVKAPCRYSSRWTIFAPRCVRHSDGIDITRNVIRPLR